MTEQTTRPVYQLLDEAEDLLDEADTIYRDWEAVQAAPGYKPAFYNTTPFPYVRAQLLTQRAQALTALANARMTGNGRA